MQKFDEEHAFNIVKDFYPTISKQVILFPLINKELTQREYQLLRPYVALVQLREGENQIPVLAPDDITGFDAESVEMAKWPNVFPVVFPRFALFVGIPAPLFLPCLL